MADDERIVAVGLLTPKNLDQFGSELQRVFPLPSDHSFDDILQRLEKASRQGGPTGLSKRS